MTADLLEERLRSALHDATSAEDGAYLDLDPDDVLGRGRRALRRRRMAAGASVAAATAVVGLAGWAALGGGVERASVPGGSPSAVLRTGVAEAVFGNSSGPGPEGGPDVSDALVRFRVDRATRHVEYLAEIDGTMTPVGEGVLPVNPRGATWVVPTAVPGLVIGVMSEAVEDQVWVWAGDAPGAASSSAVLSGTGFKAFAVWHTGKVGETTFAGFDWTDGESVFRSDGSWVPSQRDGELVAFVDEKQGLFGMFGDGSSATKRLQDTAAGGRPVMMMGNQRDGADTLVNAVLVILPAGAREVVPTATPGATVTTWSVLAAQPIDPTMVVVRIDVPLKVSGTGLGSIRWTETGGGTSTFEPRL